MAHLYVFEIRFDLVTLGSGERLLPFGLLVLILCGFVVFTTGRVMLSLVLLFVLVFRQSFQHCDRLAWGREAGLCAVLHTLTGLLSCQGFLLQLAVL